MKVKCWPVYPSLTLHSQNRHPQPQRYRILTELRQEQLDQAWGPDFISRELPANLIWLTEYAGTSSAATTGAPGSAIATASNLFLQAWMKRK
jgi:hypothetical protein